MKRWLKIFLIILAVILAVFLFFNYAGLFNFFGFSVRGYTCPEYEGSVDCMPTLCTEEFGCEDNIPEGVMCSGPYYDWTVKNCNIDYSH